MNARKTHWHLGPGADVWPLDIFETRLMGPLFWFDDDWHVVTK